MPRTEVTQVSLARPDGYVLAGGYLEHPRPGPLPAGDELTLAGWVVGGAGPAAAVEVRCRGEAPQAARVVLPRPDVARVFASRPWAAASGFRVALPYPAGPGAYEYVVRALFNSGARPVLGVVQVVTAPDEPTIPSDVTPATAAVTAPLGPVPDPTVAYPVPGTRACGFLKNLVTNPNIVVGDFTYYATDGDAAEFERENVLYASPHVGDKLVIGKYCSIARGAKFLMNAGNHLLDRVSTYAFPTFGGAWAAAAPGRTEIPYRGDTVVGNDVWIGFDALLMPGVRVGDGAVVAARAVVTRDVPPYAVAAGNPARVVRQRFPDDVVRELLAIRWWDWPAEKVSRNLSAVVGPDVAALRACR